MPPLHAQARCILPYDKSSLLQDSQLSRHCGSWVSAPPPPHTPSPPGTCTQPLPTPPTSAQNDQPGPNPDSEMAEGDPPQVNEEEELFEDYSDSEMAWGTPPPKVSTSRVLPPENTSPLRAKARAEGLWMTSPRFLTAPPTCRKTLRKKW